MGRRDVRTDRRRVQHLPHRRLVSWVGIRGCCAWVPSRHRALALHFGNDSLGRGWPHWQLLALRDVRWHNRHRCGRAHVGACVVGMMIVMVVIVVAVAVVVMVVMVATAAAMAMVMAVASLGGTVLYAPVDG